MKIRNTIITVNYPGKRFIDRALIKRARKANEQVAIKMASARINNCVTGFIFIPDVDANGTIIFNKMINIVPYVSVGPSFLAPKKYLEDDVWQAAKLNPDTFKGQVYQFGLLYSLIPKLVWDSEINMEVQA